MESNNIPQESKEAQEKKEKPIQKQEQKESYEKIPLSSYEKNLFYQQDYINDRVEQRMRMQEKAAEKMDFGISDKDKFITRKGKEQFYFYGDNVDYHIKRTKDKYDLIQK